MKVTNEPCLHGRSEEECIENATFLDVGRKRKPEERMRRIDVQRLTKNCTFCTGQIAGLALCLTANALECFPLNVLLMQW